MELRLNTSVLCLGFQALAALTYMGIVMLTSAGECLRRRVLILSKTVSYVYVVD